MQPARHASPAGCIMRAGYRRTKIFKGIIQSKKTFDMCYLRHWENPIATNKINIGQFVLFLMISYKGTPGGE